MNRCTCTSPKLDIKLPAYKPDERLASIEHICGLLIKSRFGANRQYDLLVNLTADPQPDDCVFLENTPHGLYPSYRYDHPSDSVLDALEELLLPRLLERVVKPKMAAAASARGSPVANLPSRSPPVPDRS
jgi:hypothetical protein